MKLVGDRTDDVEAFKRGDRERLLSLPKGKSFGNFALAAVSARVTRLTGTPANLGEFMLSNIDEVRDQWSHKFARREQDGPDPQGREGAARQPQCRRPRAA